MGDIIDPIPMEDIIDTIPMEDIIDTREPRTILAFGDFCLG
jgi:hypothetical protein